jgi:hypothetical protein
MENLKKVRVNAGINGAESFPAMNAPAQNIVHKTIREYILAFDIFVTP